MRKSVTSYIFVSAMLALWPCVGGADTTLCGPNEVVRFSCSTGRKLLSVCTSPDLSRTAGYIQYRFGTKDHLELEYPRDRRNSQGLFKESSVGYSRGGETHLSFSVASYKYVVVDVLTGLDPNKGEHSEASGVVILLKNRAVPKDRELPSDSVVRVIPCKSRAIGHGVVEGVLDDEEWYDLPETVYDQMPSLILEP